MHLGNVFYRYSIKNFPSAPFTENNMQSAATHFFGFSCVHFCNKYDKTFFITTFPLYSCGKARANERVKGNVGERMQRMQY